MPSSTLLAVHGRVLSLISDYSIFKLGLFPKSKGKRHKLTYRFLYYYLLFMYSLFTYNNNRHTNNPGLIVLGFNQNAID